MDDIEDYDPYAVPESEPEETPVVEAGLLQAGARFGNFQVVKCISAGLIANYYLMQHVRDLHDVTVGVFHERVSQDPRCMKRLQGLQRMLQTFSHSGVPKIRDCLEIEGSYCLCLDAVEGTTLSQHFIENRRDDANKLSLDEVSRITALLHGLIGYAHAQGVDHRDLDTDLIFLQKDGSVQVLGLGIKATLGPEVFESIVSASVSPIGENRSEGRLNSFDVMSPEYRGGIEEDSRVDIYTMGVIAYWLLTGLKIQQKDLELPPAEMVRLPIEWNQFLKNSIERNRDLRYQSSKIALLGLKQVEGEEDSEQAGLIQRQIDNIPVPKGILARGALATRVYRLCVIGVIGVTLVAFMAYALTSGYFDGAETEQVSKTEVFLSLNDEVRANLVFSTEPADAQILLKAHSKNLRAKGGKLAVELVPGDYVFDISAPDFRSQSIQVTVAEEGVSRQQIILESANADLKVVSEPGASIHYINESGSEILLGETNGEGILLLVKKMAIGVFNFRVQKDGFEALVIESFEVLPRTENSFEAKLKAMLVGITVNAIPSGAEVYIDGEKIGVTPLDAENLELKDSYVIDIKADGYRTRRRTVNVQPGEVMIVDFGQLDLQIGSLEIKPRFKGISDSESVEFVDLLRVQVDGQTYELEDPFLDMLPAGMHELSFLHPKYIADPLKIQLLDRVDKVVPVLLHPKPSMVRISMPAGYDASILVDGQMVDAKDGELLIPSNKMAKIQVEVRDHLTMVRQFTLEPTEEVVWAVNPVKISGSKKGNQWVIPYLDMKFEWIPSGSFQMGSPPVESGRLPNEGPLTEIRFSDGFWIGRFEVTQKEYSSLMQSNPSSFVSSQKPVEGMTWEDAQLFCERLTKVERAADRIPQGYVYRLPTESEWEYAARGNTTTPFHFGDTADATKGNFRGVYPRGLESDVRSPDFYGTSVVGSYSANGYGLFDVHGNVKEWTADKYNGRLRGGILIDPKIFGNGKKVAARGGSWEDYAIRSRIASRDEISAKTESNSIGFRVVLAPSL